MKHVMNATLALALGLGLSGAAYAQGMNGQELNGQGITGQEMQQNAVNPNLNAQQLGVPAYPSAVSPPGQNVSRNLVKEAQRTLKSDGFYHGKIDGMVGPKTRRAIAEFQRRNHLSQTARLDSNTLTRLTGTGVGSSMPNAGIRNRSSVNPQMSGAGGNDLANQPYNAGAGYNATLNPNATR